MSENQEPCYNPDTVSHVYIMDESGVNHQEGHFEFIRDGGHFEIIFPPSELRDVDTVAMFMNRINLEETTKVLAINEHHPIGFGTVEANEVIKGSVSVRVDSERVSSPHQAERRRSERGDTEIPQGEGRFMDFEDDSPLAEVFIGAKDEDGSEIHGKSIEEPEGRYILTRAGDSGEF